MELYARLRRRSLSWLKWFDFVPFWVLFWVALMSGAGGLTREVLIDHFPSHALDFFGKFGWGCFFVSGMAAIWKEHRGRLLAEMQATDRIANIERRLQSERQKKDGPQVVFEYARGRQGPNVKMSDVLSERMVSVRNSGHMDAFDVAVSAIRNGAYLAEIPLIPSLRAGADMTIQVDVQHGPRETILGGLMTLLTAEKEKDVPDLDDAVTAKRRFPVTIMYRDITARRYQTDFEIEYSYLFSFAQTLFIRHLILSDVEAQG